MPLGVGRVVGVNPKRRGSTLDRARARPVMDGIAGVNPTPSARRGGFRVDYLGVAAGGDGGPVTGGSGGIGGGGAGELLIGSLLMSSGDFIAVDFEGDGDIGLTGALSGTLKRGGAGSSPTGGGAPGGSGGGASNGTTSAGGASTATIGVGYAGGPGTATGSPGVLGNGGGGGGGGGPGVLGAPGPGVISAITGTQVTYAKGGNVGSGGGGGDTPGSGGHGGDGLNGVVAQAGAAGIFVFRYRGARRATGGTITKVGSYWVHTLTNDATFTVL